MPAQPRALELTRAQKKVLADLLLFRDKHNEVTFSPQQLAETTGLPVTTVASIIYRLNDLGLIRTVEGSPKVTLRHRVCVQGLGTLKPVRSAAAGGAR